MNKPVYMFLFTWKLSTLDSKPSEKVGELLNNTNFLKDVRRLSPEHQTSSLEAYHSVIIHFAPINLVE